MAKVRVSTVIESDIDAVWAVVEPLEDHVDWMADAKAIRFRTDQRRGVGTVMECDTRVGPFTTTDIMEITDWQDGSTIGVRHTGLVTGIGRFTLTAAGPSRTEFRWEEDLTFPFWMGGPLRNPVGGRVLEWIWRRNLAHLKEIVEGA